MARPRVLNPLFVHTCCAGAPGPRSVEVGFSLPPPSPRGRRACSRGSRSWSSPPSGAPRPPSSRWRATAPPTPPPPPWKGEGGRRAGVYNRRAGAPLQRGARGRFAAFCGGPRRQGNCFLRVRAAESSFFMHPCCPVSILNCISQGEHRGALKNTTNPWDVPPPRCRCHPPVF